MVKVRKLGYFLGLHDELYKVVRFDHVYLLVKKMLSGRKMLNKQIGKNIINRTRSNPYNFLEWTFSKRELLSYI